MKKDIRERFTLRLPEQLMSKLKDEAQRLGVSVNNLILQILWEWVEQDKFKLKSQ